MLKAKDEVFTELLEQIIDSGVRLLRARYGAWALLKDGRNAPEFIPARDQLGRPAPPPSISPSKVQELMAFFDDMPRPFLGVDKANAESFLSVPLPLRREIEGFLFVAEKEGAHGFGSPDIRLAELFVRIADELFQGKKTTVETRRCIRFMRETLDESSATCITDPARTVIFWSRRAEHLFGYSEREALGESIIALLVPLEHRMMQRRGFHPGVFNTIKSGDIARFESQRLHKDGRRMPVTTILSPYCYQTAGITACVCFVRFEAVLN